MLGVWQRIDCHKLVTACLASLRTVLAIVMSYSDAYTASETEVTENSNSTLYRCTSTDTNTRLVSPAISDYTKQQ